MDLEDFRRLCTTPLPPAETKQRPVMLSIDDNGLLEEGLPEDEVANFIARLGGILSEHFNLPAEGMAA